jgi:hypothetical protein
VEDLSSNMKDNNGKAVTWRRNKVLELTSQGNSQVEIASILHVGEATISRDLSHIRQQAQQNLQKHIQQKLPEEYQRCLIGSHCFISQLTTSQVSWTSMQPTPVLKVISKSPFLYYNYQSP